MALTPEQKAAAHQRGLQAKSEREAREERQKPAVANIGSDYDRFRAIGLSHEESLMEVEKRIKAEERYKQERGDDGFSGSSGIYTGPRGGRFRINSNGRKSYDVP